MRVLIRPIPVVLGAPGLLALSRRGVSSSLPVPFESIPLEESVLRLVGNPGSCDSQVAEPYVRATHSRSDGGLGLVAWLLTCIVIRSALSNTNLICPVAVGSTVAAHQPCMNVLPVRIIKGSLV